MADPRDRHRFEIHMNDRGWVVKMDGKKLHNMEQITVSQQVGRPARVLIRFSSADVDLFADAEVSEL